MNSAVIDDIVKWRMGAAHDSRILNWRDSRLNYDHPAMLDGDISGGVEIDETGVRVVAPPGRGYTPEKHKRLVDSAQDIQSALAGRQIPLSAFLAMQDARLFPSVEFMDEPDDAVCVQLSYCRTVQPFWRSRTNIVLWPLTNDFKWWRLPTFTPRSWDQRTPTLFWRGQPTGLSYDLSRDARPVLTGIRKGRRWLNGWLRDEAAGNEECFRDWAGSYQRLVAAGICKNMPGTDVKLIPIFDGDRRSIEVVEQFLGKAVMAERMEPKLYLPEQQRHKYILALPGNDVPSSLRQDLFSGAVVLMPRPFWESVWFYGLKPDVHYIELRADLADLEERLQWCRDNDAACREIAEVGRAFAFKHFDPALEIEVQRRVVELLAISTLPITSDEERGRCGS